MLRLHPASPLLLLFAALATACGTLVIEPGDPGTSDTGGGGSATTSTSWTSTPTTTWTTSWTDTPTTTWTTSTWTTSTWTTSTWTTSTWTTTTTPPPPPPYGCTSPNDWAVCTYKQPFNAVVQCAHQFINTEPQLFQCIQSSTGLSTPCTACFDTYVLCAEQHCISECVSSTQTAACVQCRQQFCDGQFLACSGLPAAPTGGN